MASFDVILNQVCEPGSVKNMFLNWPSRSFMSWFCVGERSSPTLSKSHFVGSMEQRPLIMNRTSDILQHNPSLIIKECKLFGVMQLRKACLV